MTAPLPTAVWEGEFIVFGVTVKCYVLDDGRRIIEAESMKRLLDAMYHGDCEMNADFSKFAGWMKGETP